MLRYVIHSTPWGLMALATRNDALCGLSLPDSDDTRLEADCQRRWPEAVRDDAALPDLRSRIDAYFAGEPVAFDVEVDLAGLPPFRRRMLNACRLVPYGQTTTYTQLAQRAGHAKAARAVGGAMAHNPVPLVIPCHRILRTDGGLGGFSAGSGVSLKRRLLDWEAYGQNDAHAPAGQLALA